MIGLTLKHLRYFEALARHRHFGRAAEDCSISQPALSVQVKELEDIVGAPLVERGARRIHLTALGETVAARAREVLQSIDELGQIARVAQAPLAGKLRLGVIPTIAPYFLPRMIKLLADNFPGLELYPREAVTKTLVASLLDGRLDTAIVALPVSEPSLMEQALFTEEFVLVRPAADAAKPVPDLDNLREMRLLLLEEGHCFRDQALSVCNLTSVLRRDVMEGSSLSTLVQMVGSGIGVTLIPEMAVPVELSSAPVSVARLPRTDARRTIGMVWRKTNPLAAQLMRMADVAAAARPAPALTPSRDDSGRRGRG